MVKVFDTYLVVGAVVEEHRVGVPHLIHLAVYLHPETGVLMVVQVQDLEVIFVILLVDPVE
jgi:hypothetical protein